MKARLFITSTFLGTVTLSILLAPTATQSAAGAGVWTTVSSPTTESLFSVDMVSATDGWAVGGFGGSNIIMHWDGYGWTEISSPAASGALESVDMVSATDGWAVGGGAILHWNGSSWTEVSSPTANWLGSVDMVSATDGWAVGRNGTILHWNGGTWTVVSSPTTNRLFAVDIVTATDGWIVGEDGTISHWNGSAWAAASSPAANVLWSVDMVSATDGWAVGGNGYGRDSTILRWNGSTWTRVSSPTVNELLSVDMVSATDGWAVGYSGTILHWNGSSWTEVSSLTANWLGSVDMASAMDGWAMGYGGTILRYTGGDPTFFVSGHVRDSSGDPIPEVTVSAEAGGSATTDASGAYTISGLPAGTYTLTPSKSGYTFSPPTRTVSVPPDATGKDFTAVWQSDDTPPAPVNDLASRPYAASGGVRLNWTAPGDDFYSGAATQYDIRFSTVPIDDSNWHSAVQITGEPSPSAPYRQEEMTIELPAGTRYYFALKTSDDVGNWSTLSNVPSLQDSGFRPRPDGYSFPNPKGFRPPWDLNFTREDLVVMFGKDVACWNEIGDYCILRFEAVQFWKSVNDAMTQGHCEGMAVTSSRFFRGLDHPGAFQAGAMTTYALDWENVRHHIGYYFAYQSTNPVKAYKNEMVNKPPSVNLQSLRNSLSTEDPALPILSIVRSGSTTGHTITPYAIEEKSTGLYRIWVYDNEYPNDSDRFVLVDILQNEWFYDTWYNRNGFCVTPLSEYLKTPPCAPWDKNPCPWIDTQEELLWLAGQGHLLVTDSKNRRIGFVGDQFVNEIPGAYESVIAVGLDASLEPLYNLPLTGTYTVTLHGRPVTQTEVAALTQFGPGYASTIEGVAVGPTTSDTVTFSPDGTQLTYEASDTTQEISLILALDGQDVGYEFSVDLADIGINEVVTLEVLTETEQLGFVNAHTSGGVYDLTLRRANAVGEQLFLHSDIAVSASDTHFIEYGNWGGGSITILIDHDSNGTIDEMLELENQTPRIYLPLVLYDD